MDLTRKRQLEGIEETQDAHAAKRACLWALSDPQRFLPYVHVTDLAADASETSDSDSDPETGPGGRRITMDSLQQQCQDLSRRLDIQSAILLHMMKEARLKQPRSPPAPTFAPSFAWPCPYIV